MKYKHMMIVVVGLAFSLTAAAQSDATKTFDTMKTLAGTWEGRVSTFPSQPGMDNVLTRVSLRVTSRGNSIIHEMKEAGVPEDPTRYDEPITMFYLDGDRLLLTHYCDAGNRPRMSGKTTADGKVAFDFIDVAGSTEHGHMNNAVFTVVDPNHHVEDWTYLTPGDKPVRAHMDLQRIK